MSNLIDAYLAYLSSIRSLSARTVQAYKDDLALFEASCSFSEVEIEEANSQDVRAFISDMVKSGHAVSSINRALSALKGFYRYCLRFGNIKTNPAKDIESLPMDRRLPDFMFEDEMYEFIDATNEDNYIGVRDKAIFETLFSTGCRVSEIAGLCLKDVDLHLGKAKVKGKGSKERFVFFSEEAVEAVNNYLPYREAKLKKTIKNTDSKLFLNAKGENITTRGIAYIVQQRAIKNGVRKHFSPHSFRHSFATSLVGNGADIRTVQALLGHENISTTQVYTHVDIGRLRSVYNEAHPHAHKSVVHNADALHDKDKEV